MRKREKGFKEFIMQEEGNCLTRETLSADEEEALNRNTNKKRKSF